MREFFTGIDIQGQRTIGAGDDPLWKQQANIDNPMGYEGEFVKSFAEQMGKLWMSDSMFSCWPIWFKRAIGRVNEDFQGRR